MSVASGEPCSWCGGSGTSSADANFLLARLRAGDFRWVGTSSAALVVAAMTGAEPAWEPSDGWDLGRCMVTRAVAPEHLHAAMDEIIERWTAAMRERKASSGSPYYGVDDARKMFEKELPIVQAKLAELGLGAEFHPREKATAGTAPDGFTPRACGPDCEDCKRESQIERKNDT